jgi:hypothetical protein
VPTAEAKPTEAAPGEAAAGETAKQETAKQETAKQETAKQETAKQETAPAAPVPLPDGKAVEGVPPVYLVGHGLRIQLHPPFQLARMGAAMGEHPDLVVWSWWDVNAEAAGKSGRAGLYNVSLVPSDKTVAAGPMVVDTETRRSRTLHLLRFGKGGPFLRLPEGHNALGGMGVAELGPPDPVWRFQVGDGPLLEWEDKLMVHSGDPAKGESVRFLVKPVKPWGPWTEGG